MIKNLRLVLMSMLMLVCGSAFAENVIWSEDWSGYEAGAVPSAMNPAYSEVDSGTKIYNDKLAGGTAPELLIAKKQGQFTAVVNLDGNTGEMTLSYMANYDRITVTAEGATLGDKTKSGNNYTIPVTVEAGASQITLVFTNTQTSNVRFDDVKLYQGEAKKNAGLSWGTASRTVTIGSEENNFPTLSNENGLTVTYSSSNEDVATIDAEGVITLVAAGKTTISAAFEGNDEFDAQTVSYELTVNGGSTPDDPHPSVDGGTLENPFTVANALEFIAALEGTAATSDSYYVKGIVVGTPDFQRNKDGELYGNVNFTMGDEAGATALLTVYRAKNFGNENFTEETIGGLKEGDEVVVYGKLQNYKGETPEVTSGYLYSVNGKTAEEPVAVTVAAPVFTPDGGEFEESIEVVLTCATEGATIKYAVADNSDAYDWQEYTAPIILTETTALVAYAEKEGMESSTNVFATFTKKTVEEPVGEGIVFDFNEDEAIATLFPTITSYSSGSGQSYVADGEFNETTTSTAIEGVTVTVTASDAEKSTRNRLWATAPRLRMYDGAITFASAGNNIVKIEMTRSTNKNLVANSNTADSGELTTSDQQNNGVVTWTGDAQSVTINIAGNTQFSKAVVWLAEEGNKADVDNNGTVDLADVRVVIDVIQGNSENARADVNSDGNVDIADILSVLSNITAE